MIFQQYYSHKFQMILYTGYLNYYLLKVLPLYFQQVITETVLACLSCYDRIELSFLLSISKISSLLNQFGWYKCFYT